jgi:hypothetical protein
MNNRQTSKKPRILILGSTGRTRLEGPLTSTIVFFLLREFFADLGPWYLMSLRAFAIIVNLTMPKGIAGLLAERFDPGLFPLRRRVLAYRLTYKMTISPRGSDSLAQGSWASCRYPRALA